MICGVWVVGGMGLIGFGENLWILRFRVRFFAFINVKVNDKKIKTESIEKYKN